LIPAVEVTTEVRCETRSNEDTVGCQNQDVRCEEEFSLCGNLRTEKFICAQGTNCETDEWDESGSGSCELHKDEEIDEPCHCRHCGPLSNAARHNDLCDWEDNAD